MSYTETKTAIGVKITLICEARKGRGICGTLASCECNDRKFAQQFLSAMGWRLLRGHQVCGNCLATKRRIVFPCARGAGSGDDNAGA